MHKLPLSPLHSWGRTGGTAARLIHSLRLSLLHPGHHPHSPSSYERPKNEAGQRLIDFCQENTLVIENTLFQQHKKQLFTWTSQPLASCKSTMHSANILCGRISGLGEVSHFDGGSCRFNFIILDHMTMKSFAGLSLHHTRPFAYGW